MYVYINTNRYEYIPAASQLDRRVLSQPGGSNGFDHRGKHPLLCLVSLLLSLSPSLPSPPLTLSHLARWYGLGVWHLPREGRHLKPASSTAESSSRL